MKIPSTKRSWSSLLPIIAFAVVTLGASAEQKENAPPPKQKKAQDFPPAPQFVVTSPLMTIAAQAEAGKVGEAKDETGTKKSAESGAGAEKVPATSAKPTPAIKGKAAKKSSDEPKPGNPPEPIAREEGKAKTPDTKPGTPQKPGPNQPAPSGSTAPVVKKPEAISPGAQPKPAGSTEPGKMALEPGAPPMILPKPDAKPSPLPKGAPDLLTPIPAAEPFVITRTTQLVGSLHGITLFADTRKDIDDTPKSQPQSLSSGVNLIGLETPKPEELKEMLQTKYLGKPLTFEKLDQMVKDILGFYSAHGRPMTHVYIPEQQVTDKVKIAVLEGRFGEVKEVVNEGRIWYSTDDIKHAVRLEHGEVVDEGSIAGAMRSVNVSPWARLGQSDAHPFRRVTATFLPGTELGLTDLKIDVEDRIPVRWFAGYDNTGPALLGEHRLNLGGVWYDVFGLGWNHQLGVQAQSDLEFERFHALLLNYQVPILHWGPKQYFQIFAGYMNSTVEIPAGGGIVQELEGTNLITGVRYHFGLPDWFITEHAKEATRKDKEFALYQEFGLGVDYKTADNNFAFGGFPVFGVQTDIVQAVLEYNARETDKWGETSLTLAGFWSPGGLTSNNSDVQFNQSRQGATASYLYGRATVGRRVDLPYDLIFQLRGTVQWASENLLSSEQLGLGGYDTVRGYSERIARGDFGFFIQTELYSPAIHPLRKIAKRWPDRWLGKDNSDDELRFLVFLDYGKADVVNFTTAEPGDITMMSAGVGLRYRFNRRVTLRIDYGMQLEKLDPTQFFLIEDPLYSLSDDSYIHIGLTCTF